MTLLNQAEQQEVTAAISRLERETDAEVVTVLTAQADNYAYIPLVWAGLAALLVPGLLNLFTNWLNAHSLVLTQWALFVVLALIFRVPQINSHLIPAPVRYWRASNLARRQFLEQNLHHTEGGTGMLIFVSEAERYVEILVDQGISSRIPDATWGGIVEAFVARVRQKKTLEGFLECIDACGAELKEKLPATHERNELPNHLVVLD
ncbi:MAG: hypothetical protein CL583_15315 [Alteromonadaceae bacterium]|nr:hypothetical protein [Alteromonadaceae bacterium]|tara:strand:+ start:50 stop:667 length:618 start_codon:yes stop_codon:yes gene_type:complete